MECIPSLISEKNIEVLARHGVLTKTETESRYEIMLENYIKTINIEALTMLEMAKRYIQPTAFKAAREAAATRWRTRFRGSRRHRRKGRAYRGQRARRRLCRQDPPRLKRRSQKPNPRTATRSPHARGFQNEVKPAMATLRDVGDALETIVDASLWPFPTYADLLFKV